MPVFTTTSALPRQELALAIVEGEGAVDSLIGEKILPPFPITQRTAHIIKATLANSQALRVIDDAKFVHAPGTKFERMTATFGDDTLSVVLRGEEIVVPNETTMDYAAYLSVEAFFAGRFGQTAALTKEKLIAAQIFNTGNFAATNSAVAYTVANLATISFIGDIIAAIRRVKDAGEIPDTVALSGPVFERIRQAATVQGYVAGTLRPGADATLNTIQQALAEYGIKQVLVGDSYYNNAADQATASLSQVWSNTYIWVGKAGKGSVGSETGGLSVPQLGGLGANIYWEGYDMGGKVSTDSGAMRFAGGNYVESYPDISIDSMVLRVKMSSVPYLGNLRTGTLVATQYS
jgi:hypothetical protein